MDLNDLYQAGSDISDAVTDALSDRNFQKLNQVLDDTVQSIRDTVAPGTGSAGSRSGERHYSEAGKPGKNTAEGTYYRYSDTSGAWKSPGSESAENVTERYEREAAQRRAQEQAAQSRYNPSSNHPVPFIQKKISHYNGIVPLVCGSIGTVFSGFLTTICAIVTLEFFFGDVDIAAGIIALIFTALSGGLTAWLISLVVRGKKTKDLTKSYFHFANAIGSREYIAINELAAMTDRSRDDTIRDLKEMKKRGFLTHAWLDQGETTLMLTAQAHQDYLQAEKARMERERAEAAAAPVREAAAQQEKKNAEVEALLQDGENYLNRIRAYNDAIPGQEMSDKLDRMALIIERILTQVRKDPDSAQSLRRLMNYYLPTTMKLLQAYTELDQVPNPGETVQQTRSEIESAVDTINQAFEKLLDSLFQDMNWDISSDINVMKHMMAQDDLLRDTPLRKAARQESSHTEDPTEPVSGATWPPQEDEDSPVQTLKF